MTGEYYDLEPWQRDGLDKAIARDEAATRLTGPPDPEPPSPGRLRSSRPVARRTPSGSTSRPPHAICRQWRHLMAKAEAQADWMLDGHVCRVGGFSSLCVAPPKARQIDALPAALMLSRPCEACEFLGPAADQGQRSCHHQSRRLARARPWRIWSKWAPAPTIRFYWAGHSRTHDATIRLGEHRSGCNYWIESDGRGVLTVIDPLFRYLPACGYWTTRPMAEVTRALDPLIARCPRYRLPISWRLHHARKSGRRGTAAEVLGSSSPVRRRRYSAEPWKRDGRRALGATRSSAKATTCPIWSCGWTRPAGSRPQASKADIRKPVIVDSEAVLAVPRSARRAN